jgi:DNA-binding beta-propeller fold protein YncE
VKNQFLFLFVFLLLAVGFGCSDDCPTCPDNKPLAEKEYHFLYSFVGPYGQCWVYTFSTKTGRVIDSTYYGGFPAYDVRFSKDGQYVFYSVREETRVATWITNYATGDTVAIASGIYGYSISLSGDGQYLLLSDNNTVRLLRIPSLEVIYQGGPASAGTIHPFRNVAYIPNWPEDSLLVVDFQTPTLTDSKVPLKLGYGDYPFSAISAAVSLDGRILILEGGVPGGSTPRIQLRDAETLEVLQDFADPTGGGPYLHPDGERVFFLEPWKDFYAQPGSVWVLSLKTFLLTRILNSVDFRGYFPFMGLNPDNMDFTPDGKYALITNGGQMEYGPIIKLDMDTYKIVDAFYPPGGVSWWIRINPIEIKAGR